MGDVREPALAALETLLGARRLLARRAHGLERRARGPVGLGERILALGEGVGCVAASPLRGLDLIDQRTPLLLEQARSVLEARARLLRLRDARSAS